MLPMYLQLPFYPLALDLIRAGNTAILETVLTQHPHREQGINATNNGGLRGTNANFSLMMATFYAETLTATRKVTIAEMLLDAGFNVINMGRMVLGVIEPTAMEAACIKALMEGVEQDAHLRLIQLLIKHGGDPFLIREPGARCAYDWAKEDFPYLLHENGGPFPVPTAAYLKQRNAKGFLSMMTAVDFEGERHA